MKRAVKAGTLKLCLPLLVMTAHQNAVGLIVPPFFQQLGYPVSAIGTFISVAWIFTFAARLPSGLVYKPGRARILLAAYLVCMAGSSAAYSVAVQPVPLALVQAFNGFANGGATTVYFAFFVDALPAGENRHHAMGYYAGALAVGYSLGGFLTGYVADRLGYAVAFWFASLIVLGSLSLFLILARPVPLRTGGGPAETMTVGSLLEALKTEPNSQIGGGFAIPHPNGIVIHPDAQIGPNCLFFQQVTIGMRGSEGVPTIGGHVDIGAGAKVLGGLRIGDHACIGANAVVLSDVPAGATAVGIPARVHPPAAKS